MTRKRTSNNKSSKTKEQAAEVADVQIIHPAYLFISGATTGMSVAWALLWLAFSLFVDAELIYDAVMSNTFLVSALTFLPISAMFFVERKLRTMYANPQSSSFGHVLLMFSRFFGAFAIYMIMRIVYFPMIFPDTYKVAEVVETVVADAAASL